MAEHLERAEPDLLRSMLSTFIQALMSAEADAVCGAAYGSRARSGPTRATATGPGTSTPVTGTMEVAIPKLREGSYFPTGCSSGAGGPSRR